MRCSQMTNDSILSDTLKVDVHTYEVNWVAYTGGGFFLTRKDLRERLDEALPTCFF